MQLSDLNSGPKGAKGWLNIIAKSITAETADIDIVTIGDLVVDDITADLLTLNNQVSVPNPSVGATTFWSSGSGNLSQTDEFSTTVTYATIPPAGAYVVGTAPSVINNLSMFDTVNADSIVDSGIASSNVFLADGSIPASAPFNLNNQDILSTGNIAPYYDQTHDIGSASLRYKDLYLSGDLIGPSQQMNDGVQNQAEVLAPAFQRYQWQYPTTAANGSGLIYIEPLDIVLSYSNTTGANAIRYSSDHGVNYTNVTYDTAGPVGFAIVGYSPSLALVVAIGQGSNESYTSVDGINFVQGPNLPSSTAESFNIEWFETGQVFVVGVQDVGQKIMTSADGLTWTLRNSPTQALTLKSSDTLAVPVIVAVGAVFPYIQYSFDGILWGPTVSVVDYCRALAFSEERKEFLALGYNTGVGYRSLDGVTWSNLGTIAPVQVNDALKWMAYGYNRYYLSKTDTVGNYSLWSTLDPLDPFLGTQLDGAEPNPLTYSIAYISSIDRMILGTNNTKAAYSNPRNDIKALSDNIRVRNMAVHVDCYSTYADINVDNTVVETVLSSASSIGTTTFQRNLQLGAVINLNVCLIASSVAGDTLTLRVKAGTAGTGLLYSHILTIPALSVNLPIQIRDKLSIRNGVIQMNGVEELNGFVNNVQASAIVFDRTVQNIFNVSAQWSANVNQAAFNAITYDCMFRNGA